MGAIPHIHSTSQSHSLFHHGAASSQHDKLVKQSQRLVSQTFFGTLLKQMHSSPFKSELLDGGHGGEAFSSMLDQHLMDRMAAHGSAKKLVDSIVKSIEQGEAKRKHERIPPKKSHSQRRFQQSGYLKSFAANHEGRQDVPTSLRA